MEERRNIMKTNILYKTSIVLLLIVILFTMFFAIYPKVKVSAESENNIVTNAVSDESAPFFDDLIAQPRWLTVWPALGWTTNSDFSALSYNYASLAYPGNLRKSYFNEEFFSLIGKDETGESFRLHPVNSMGAVNNINANGFATITFNEDVTELGTCSRTYHYKSMSNLQSAFRVNKNQNVGKGKILYRTTSTDFGDWTPWSFCDPYNSLTLSFTQRCVQIVILYKLTETGTMFQKNYDYYIAGIYRFNIY